MSGLIAISPLLKSTVILCVLLTGSILQNVELTPRSSFFRDEENFINIYLVKWSWGWTLLCIAPVVVMASVLYTGANMVAVLRHCARLGVSHVLWFSLTSLFNSVNKRIGECSDQQFSNRGVCLRHGAEWDGLDISGHVFLLTYCILVITEEVSCVGAKLWHKYGELLASEKSRMTKESRTSILLEVYAYASFLIPVLRLIATLEMFVWFIMVISTSCNFFHTFAEKIIGFGVSILSWFVTYKVWYGSKWAPSKPEDGILNPMKIV